MVYLLRSQHHQPTIVVCRIGASMLPVCSTVCKMVPEGKRKTTSTVLKVNDLAKLPAAKLRQIRDWLVATVMQGKETFMQYTTDMWCPAHSCYWLQTLLPISH